MLPVSVLPAATIPNTSSVGVASTIASNPAVGQLPQRQVVPPVQYQPLNAQLYRAYAPVTTTQSGAATPSSTNARAGLPLNVFYGNAGGSGSLLMSTFATQLLVQDSSAQSQRWLDAFQHLLQTRYNSGQQPASSLNNTALQTPSFQQQFQAASSASAVIKPTPAPTQAPTRTMSDAASASGTVSGAIAATLSGKGAISPLRANLAYAKSFLGYIQRVASEPNALSIRV